MLTRQQREQCTALYGTVRHCIAKWLAEVACSCRRVGLQVGGIPTNDCSASPAQRWPGSFRSVSSVPSQNNWTVMYSVAPPLPYLLLKKNAAKRQDSPPRSPQPAAHSGPASSHQCQCPVGLVEITSNTHEITIREAIPCLANDRKHKPASCWRVHGTPERGCLLKYDGARRRLAAHV